MSPPHCPNCAEPVSWLDQYCADCGRTLASLRWKTSDEGWKSGEDRVAVREGMSSVRVLLGNDGVVPVGLVLRSSGREALPRWVDRDELPEDLFRIPPGEEVEVPLDIPLVEAEVDPLFAGADGHSSDQRLEAQLVFQTSLGEVYDQEWRSRLFDLTLVVARQPRITPAGSVYRFVPWERLQDEGIVHEIVLHNESLAPLEVTAVKIIEAPHDPPPRHVLLPATRLLRRIRRDEAFPIASGGRERDRIRISASGLGEYDGVLGWFSAIVEYTIRLEGRNETLPVLIQGSVGRGPSLVLEGETAWIADTPALDRERRLVLRNPGHLPVRVEALQVVRTGDGAVPERDWLRIQGLTVGEVVSPGEERSLTLSLDYRWRPHDEAENEWVHRTVRVVHDGWQVPDRRLLTLEVSARFGRVIPVTAGIDFGTSNSTICLWAGRRAHLLKIETGQLADPQRLASLMYFNELDAREGAEDPFLFGDQAHSSAEANPAHLVRSIKTVVARNPQTRYLFVRRGKDGNLRRVERTPQQLLDRFISELRDRGERAVHFLDEIARRELQLGETQVEIRTAVFSHPVEMTGEMRRALMAAAHSAGINQGITDLDTFFSESCVDEATAATLAYVRARVEKFVAVEHELVDCERVLCVDMGGGTTDVAAVEVRGMASFVSNKDEEAEPVSVDLAVPRGARFGGDDLDSLVAELILREVVRQAEQRGLRLPVGDIVLALSTRSYKEFHVAYLGQHRSSPGAEVDREAAEEMARKIYRKATEILRRAEQAKRNLGQQDSDEISFPAEDWPLPPGTPRNALCEPFRVRIERDELAERIGRQVDEKLWLLDVVKEADWQWDSITTLLFTGQSIRVPVVRERIRSFVEKQRGSGAVPLICIEPDSSSGFDPKGCVAIGAAVWGESRTSGGAWLKIEGAFRRQALPFDLQRLNGPRYRRLENLRKGSSLPAEENLSFPLPVQELSLFRNQRPYIQFRFPPTRALTVRAASPTDLQVIVDGQPYSGEIQ